MDRTLKLGYAAGSLILSTCLLAALAAWYLVERKLEVYPIFERRQEMFYWTAVLLSNSLGTAFGDFLSEDLKLSYMGGAFVTAGIIGLVVLLHYVTRIHDIALFWIAFVFTRPFGATDTAMTRLLPLPAKCRSNRTFDLLRLTTATASTT